jgi:putative hydrolase of the HAD superfamily
MYKHIFFDLDHTIWDFETNAKESLKDLYYQMQLESKGVDSFENFIEKYLVHNTVMWEKYHRGEITAEELKWRRMHRTLVDFKIGNEDLAKEMAVQFLEILPEKKGVFEATYEVLDYLKSKNYQLHLITNGFEITQHRKLKSSGLDTYFTKVITSEATGFVKPNKEIYDHALLVTGATIHESIMIGDNVEADIKGAYNAGWQTVFANHINAEVPKEAHYTITHLKELEGIF